MSRLRLSGNNKWFLQLLIPVFLQNVLYSLMGTVDTFMVSAHSSELVAAIGYSDRIIGVVQKVCVIVSLGTIVVIPQYIGAGKDREAKGAAKASMLLAGGVGLVAGLCLLGFSGPLLNLLRITEDLRDNAVIYLSIAGAGMLFFAFTMTATSIMRCYKLASTALLISVSANVLNIIGNYLVIFQLNDTYFAGARGVAFSTVISQGIAAVIYLIILIKKVKISLKIKVELAEYIKICKVGLPAVGESFSYTLSQLVVTTFITNLGSLVLAAHIYGMNIMILVSRLSYSIGTVSGIMTGEMVGANKMREAKRTVHRNTLYAIGSVFLCGIIPIICAAGILTIFTDDPVVIQMARMVMMFEFVTLIFKSCNFVFGDSLRGSGDVVFPVVSAVISMWMISAGGAYILGYHFELGLAGILIAFLADELLRAVILFIRWQSNKWQDKRLVA